MKNNLKQVKIKDRVELFNIDKESKKYYPNAICHINRSNDSIISSKELVTKKVISNSDKLRSHKSLVF